MTTSVAVTWGPGLLFSAGQVLSGGGGALRTGVHSGVGEPLRPGVVVGAVKGRAPGVRNSLACSSDVAKRVNGNLCPLFSRSQPRLPSYLFYLSITLVCLQQVRKTLLLTPPGPANPEGLAKTSLLLSACDLADALPWAPARSPSQVSGRFFLPSVLRCRDPKKSTALWGATGASSPSL